MHEGLMSIIKSQNKTNRQLVEALEQAHIDLEDLKSHIACMEDPESKACSCSQEIVRSVTEQDSRPELLENAERAQPEGFKQLYVLINELADNNAVHSDRKIRIQTFVKALETQVNTLQRRWTEAQDRAQEAEDLVNYHKSQAQQYQKNWETLSKRCREFARHFNREAMAGTVAQSMDDMLSECEVESHNT